MKHRHPDADTQTAPVEVSDVRPHGAQRLEGQTPRDRELVEPVTLEDGVLHIAIVEVRVAIEPVVDTQRIGGEATADLMSGEIRVRAEGAGERSGERISGNDWVLEQHPPLQPVLGLPGMHESVRLFLDAVEAGSESADAAGTARLARLFRLGLAAEESKRSGGWEAVS